MRRLRDCSYLIPHKRNSINPLAIITPAVALGISGTFLSDHAGIDSTLP